MTFESEISTGERFEKYVIWRLAGEGFHVTRWETKHDQLAHGDVHFRSGENLEIKFDRGLNKHGNLFIEVKERHDVGGPWVPSGIYAQHDAELYGVGDYRDWYVFQRVVLQELVVAGGRHIFTIKKDTSQGFLLKPIEFSQLKYRERHWLDMTPLGKVSEQGLRMIGECFEN